MASAAVVRLAFGSTAGFPSPRRVTAGLAELGIPIRDLTVSMRQRAGAAHYAAVDLDGRALDVTVLGRDAPGPQRLANVFRSLAYRSSGPRLATGRLHQVEHESLVTLFAERGGVRVPSVTDDFLLTLWRQAAMLRCARVAHSQLNLSNVLATDDGPMVVRFPRGRIAAAEALLDIDLAELLVATSIATSPQRALASALPYVQREALTPHLRDLARGHELRLEELRRAVAAETGVELPDIAPLHRLRVRDLALMAAVMLAAYLLISQLAQIGFDTIAYELSQALWPWVVVALGVAQTTLATQAVSIRGAVPTPLPYWPCVALESAIKFVNLTVPSSAGRIALKIRFLQKLGVPFGEAIASGAVDGFSDTIVQIVLVLLILPFVDLAVALPSGATGGRLGVREHRPGPRRHRCRRGRAHRGRGR